VSASAEADTMTWMNLARTGSKKVVEELERISKSFTDKSNPKIMVEGNTRVLTVEGKAAVLGAIKAMKKHKAVTKLYGSLGLNSAARELVKEEGPKGLFSHTGPDGSSPFSRMNRFGKWGETAGENLASGSNNGKAIVMQLLIDDGIPSRAHRKNILNPAYHKAGVAVGKNKSYGWMTCIDYAGTYVDKSKK